MLQFRIHIPHTHTYIHTYSEWLDPIMRTRNVTCLHIFSIHSTSPELSLPNLSIFKFKKPNGSPFCNFKNLSIFLWLGFPRKFHGDYRPWISLPYFLIHSLSLSLLFFKYIYTALMSFIQEILWILSIHDLIYVHRRPYDWVDKIKVFVTGWNNGLLDGMSRKMCGCLDPVYIIGYQTKVNIEVIRYQTKMTVKKIVLWKVCTQRKLLLRAQLHKDSNLDTSLIDYLQFWRIAKPIRCSQKLFIIILPNSLGYNYAQSTCFN